MMSADLPRCESLALTSDASQTLGLGVQPGHLRSSLLEARWAVLMGKCRADEPRHFYYQYDSCYRTAHKRQMPI